MAEERVLRVLTSEFLPVVEDREDNTIYFVYDKMELHLGKSFYSDPFCIVEELPTAPVDGMLYITTDGLVQTYVNYSWFLLGRCLTEDEVELLTKAGSVYFMKAEYRYLDLQTRSIVLPYQNGTYQLSVNLAKCLQIDKDTVIYYDETTGHFEIDGNRNDTELHVNHGYEGVDTKSIKTTIEGNRIFSDLKLSALDGNILKIYEGGLYANTDQYATQEELEEISELYISYKYVIESMITELHEEMEDKGYNTTTEMIAEKIAQALQEYEPTIQDLITNYNLIYEQLGYIRDLASQVSGERIEEVKQEIIDYLDQIREAWAEYDRDSEYSIDDDLYTAEEQEYLANAIQKAVDDIKLRRKNPDPIGTSVPFSFMYIGGTDSVVPTKQITPPKLDVITRKSRFIGYTNIYIVDEKVNPEDEYYYSLSHNAPAWMEDVVSAGIYTRMSDLDIECDDGQEIIIVEVDANKKAIKYNLVLAKVRTRDYTGMEILNIEAFEGTEDYHMRLDVDPPKEFSTNKYMYAETTVMPEYEELIPYNYYEWDGEGEIDLSMFPESLITLVECDPTYSVMKVGTFRAYAHEVLRTLNITSNYGDAPGTTILYISPGRFNPDNDYYISNTADSTVFNAFIPLDSRWKYWDGLHEVESTLGAPIAVAECENGRAKRFGIISQGLVNNTYQYFIDTQSVTYTGYIENTIVDNYADDIYYKPYAAGDPWIQYGENIPSGYARAQMTSPGVFIVPFERDVENNLITTHNGTVYKFVRRQEPVIILANDIYVFATKLGNKVYISFDNADYPSPTYKYYYQLMTVDDTRQYYMNEPLEPLTFVEWDGTSSIPLESSNFIMVKLAIVDTNNTIVAIGKAEIEE